ncbi:hypothetical protein TRFO_22354 [Tritrichomonas foetus]|uniref:IQ calmodulin-binding motif family protein n=1 Tax=Tritrichomonas foetus TaxID=1144522 RepID=A0A1J4KDE5_9EUKA|nr:hypothetical protein TRFO_22354 [Tritrichomonas foetus]|eukprot:OHT08936.1 hypothetical protein TRFO_22354 [Tritrichomonas foetus]
MQKTPRSDLVKGSGRMSTTQKKTKFQFYERRSTTSQFRKTYSRSTARSRDCNTLGLTFDQDAIEKFDKTDRPASKSINRITNHRILETPRSIKNFVMFSKEDADLMNAAQLIQRNWRIHLSKMQLRFFMNFILKIRRRRLSFAISMWHLAVQPTNHEKTKKSYDSIFNFIIQYQFIDLRSTDLWMKRGPRLRFYPFDDYMKTNILFSKFPSNKIVNMTKYFNQNIIKKTFQAWFAITSERLIVNNQKSLVFAKFRQNFGPEYWTFHVWRRWATYKKRRKWELVETIASNLYVPEWTFYRARKLTEARMRRDATLSYKIKLGKQIIQLFRDSIHKQKMLKCAYDQTVYYSNKLRLIFGYRAFSYLIIFKRVKQGILLRIMKAWYTFIDAKMLNRTKIQIFYQRQKLKALKQSFKLWRKNIVLEAAKTEFLHNDIVMNRLKVLPSIFLLKNDNVHFTYVQAFINWQKIVNKKKRLRRFVFWSTKMCKNQVLMRFIFDILKEKAKLPVNRVNYQPFHDTEIYSIVNKPGQEFISCPTSSISETIHAYKNLPAIPVYEGDWARYASSRQVKTLVFRLICLVAFRHFINPFHISEIKLKNIKNYIERKQLFTQLNIAAVRYQHHKDNLERKKEVNGYIKRDNEILSAFETHSTAIKLSHHVPKFSINKNIKLFHTSPETFANNEYYSDAEEDLIVNEEEEEETDYTTTHYRIKHHSDDDNYEENENKNDPESDSENSESENDHENIENETDDINEEKRVTFEDEEFRNRSKRRRNRGRRSAPSIPFLRPIKEIKESLMKMTSKFHRRPFDAFSMRGIANRKARQSLDPSAFHKSASESHFGSCYEHYVPFQFNKSLVNLLKGKDFEMAELKALKKQAAEVAEVFEEKPVFEEEETHEYEYITDDDLSKFIKSQNEEEEMDYMTSSRSKVSQETISSTSSKASSRTSSGMPQLIKFGNLLQATPHPSKIKKKNEIYDSPLEEEEEDEHEKPAMKTDNSEKVNEISRKLTSTITTLNDMEKHFLNDAHYFTFSQPRRVALLTNNYFSVIDILLGNPFKSKLNTKQSNNSALNDDEEPQTNVSKLLRKIEKRIKAEDEECENKTPVKVRERKKRGKLFEDPDRQFKEEPHSDGNKYQKSTCPEFANVLFSGVKVLSNTPWNKTKKNTTSNKNLPTPSLPTAETVVPGFEPSNKIQKLGQGSSLFTDKNPDIKKALEDILSTPGISDDVKQRILFVIDLIAKRYLDEEVEKYVYGELTSFVEVDPNDLSSDENPEVSPVFQLRKPPKIEPIVNKKFGAFDTESREKAPIRRYKGEREVFYKDLALAVLECSKFAYIVDIKDVEDITKEQSALESLRILRRYQQRQTISKLKVEQHLAIIPLPDDKGPQVFSAGGYTKRYPPHKIQSTVKETKVRKNRPSNEIPKIEIAKIESKQQGEGSPNRQWPNNQRSLQNQQINQHGSKMRKATINTPGSPKVTVRIPKASKSALSSTKSIKHMVPAYIPIEYHKNFLESTTNSRPLVTTPHNVETPKKAAKVKETNNKYQNSVKSKSLNERNVSFDDSPSSNSSSIPNPKTLVASHNDFYEKKRQKEQFVSSETISENDERPKTAQKKLIHSPQRPLIMKRKPQFTKFEPTLPEDPIEFDFDFNDKISTTRSSFTVNQKPKWTIPNDRKAVTRKDIKYFMYVTPFIEPEENEENDAS